MDQAYRRMSILMPAKAVYDVDQLQTMRWCKQAFKNVSNTIIKNCFHKTQIMAAISNTYEPGAIILEKEIVERVKANLSEIYGVDDPNTFEYEVETAEEASSVHPYLSDDEILLTVMGLETQEVEEPVEEVSTKRQRTLEEKIHIRNDMMDILEDEDDSDLKEGIRKL